jgi:hypothetical protein
MNMKKDLDELETGRVEEVGPELSTDCYDDYTFVELGWFIHLLTTRILCNDNKQEREKDLQDAKVYAAMVVSKLDDFEKELEA